MKLGNFRSVKWLNLVVCLVFCFNFAFSNSVLAFDKDVSMLRPEAASKGGGRVLFSMIDRLLEEQDKMTIAEVYRADLGRFLKDGANTAELINVANEQVKQFLVEGKLINDYRISYDKGNIYFFITRSNSRAIEDTVRILPSIVDTCMGILVKAQEAGLTKSAQDLKAYTFAKQVEAFNIEVAPAVKSADLQGWAKLAFEKQAIVSTGEVAPYTRDYATLDNVNVAGKTVLVRPDINVQAENGHIKNMDRPHARVIEAAKTIKELADKNAKVIVIFHQGRPGEPDFMDTPDEHAQQMSALVGNHQVIAVNDLFGAKAIVAIKALKPGQILFLRPVRAADPSNQGKILEENPYFTSILRKVIDFFCLDGFSVAHRDSESVTGFKGVPTIAGRLMASEIEGLTEQLNPAKPYFVIVGGGKLSDKFGGFEGALKSGKADKAAAGGRLANLVLVAMQPEAAGVKSEEGVYALAVKTVGKLTADEFKKENDFQFLARLVELLIKHKDKIIVPTDMVYLDETGNRQVIDLIGGRVPEGFSYLLKGIGPKTVQQIAEAIRQGNFKTGYFTGPLTDSRYDNLLEENRIFLEALKQIPFWVTGGGDTDSVVDKLGYKPSFRTLAGSASGEFLAGKKLPGVELVKNNRPDKIKTFVPSTGAGVSALAHTEVLGTVAKVFKGSGDKIFVRTHLFLQGTQGTRVDSARFTKTPMSDAVLEALRNDNVDDVIGGFETVDVDAQNPFISFSISNLYTKNHRPINPALLRRALAANGDVALILVPGEVGKKGKMGPAGDIDSRKITDKLEKILNVALREHGVDARTVKAAEPKPLPAIVQVTESGIKMSGVAIGALELKLALLIPTPGTEIYRLMQLAQDAGINLKGLLEKELPVTKNEIEVQNEAKMAQMPLLGESPVLAELAEKEVKTQATSPLAGLRLGGVKINEALQTIFYGDPYPLQQQQQLLADNAEIQERVLKTDKVVRIVVPAGSETERVMNEILEVQKNPLLTIGVHTMFRYGFKSTAFILRPTKHVVIVGYGNEAVKLAPLYKAAGFGNPAIAIHSLMRSERVVHAFEMGYYVHLTDISKDKSGNVVRAFENPAKLEEAERELKNLLAEAFTAKARNKLLADLPESERLKKANDSSTFKVAKEIGRRQAEASFAKQYRGVLSKAILAGMYDIIDDATPEGSGANNRDLMYEPAIKANPDKKIVVIYQGGEKAGVGQGSFSTLAATFEDVTDLTHVRHVSCNTTGLSTIVLPLLENLGVAIDVDNTALRRGPDPGDLKGVPASISMSSNYHHWPDVLTVARKDLQALMQGNTDAAQIGTNTRFHIHMLYIRRADGRELDINKVKRIMAVQSRVALVDFPGDSFDSVRLTELAHNLLPQRLGWAPDGADHLLIPVLMVQKTDDPAQLRLTYAVPQESIVAPGNINAADALFGHAAKDASIAIINDLSGISEIVSAVETRLPVKGLDEPGDFGITKISPSRATALNNPTVRLDVELAGGAKGRFVVPAGTSSGEDEAKTVGVDDALKSLQRIHEQVKLRELRADQLIEIARSMLNIGKDALGAEATLSYQMAVAWAAAEQKGLQHYEFIRQLAPDLASVGAPRTKIQYNITNGGQHAANSLDMQEFMVVASGKTIAEANKMCDEIDRQLGLIYQALGLKADPDDKGVGKLRGKEGGYKIEDLTLQRLAEIYANIDKYKINNLNILALREQNAGVHEFVLNCLLAAIKNAGYKASTSGEAGTVALALDAAATSMLVEGREDLYNFEGRQITATELIGIYAGWIKKYPVDSIEDGLGENDWQGWSELITAVGDKVLVIGDDLLVTQAGRLLKLIQLLKDKNLIDANGKVTKNIGILIKLNQNGFLTTGINDSTKGYLGTLEVIRLANKYGMKWVVSHRSNEAGPEENEVSIADLAAGTNAYALKSGDHVQAIRAVKEDRLAEIYASEERQIAEVKAKAAVPAIQAIPAISVPTPSLIIPPATLNTLGLAPWTRANQTKEYYESLLALQSSGVSMKLGKEVFKIASDAKNKKVVLISLKVLLSDPSLILALQNINQQINQHLGQLGNDTNIANNAYRFILVDDVGLQSTANVEKLFADIARITKGGIKANSKMFDMILLPESIPGAAAGTFLAADLIKQLEKSGVSSESITGLLGAKQWVDALAQVEGVSKNVVRANVEATAGKIALAANALFGTVELVAKADATLPEQLELLRETISSITVQAATINTKVEDEIEAYRKQVEVAIRV